MLDTFSKRLRELIEIEGISGRVFARETGLSRKSIYNWLKGRQYPRYDSLLCIADYFNVKIDYLLGLDDNMYEQVGDTYKKTDLEVRECFYSRIRKLMSQKGMTGYRLAKLLSLRQCTVLRWIRGTGMPEVYHLIKIASVFHLSVDELLVK